MSAQELVRTLDYILNRCSEQDIDAVAEAVVRRRRDIALYGDMSAIPDPRSLAQGISSQLNMDGYMEGLQASIKDYAIRIIKQHAPELTEEQIDELTNAWIPGSSGKPGSSVSGESKIPQESSIPKDLLVSMIDQFVAFSLGRMEEEEDRALRKDIGPWPDKYWKAFPQVIRLIITDFLKGEITEGDFKSRLGLALQLK